MSISPNVPTPQESYNYESTGTPRWIAVLFVILFVAMATLGFLGYSGIARLESSLAKQQEQNRVVTAQLEQANARLADLKGHVEVTEQKVGMTQAELAQAKSRAEAIRKEQQASDEKLTSQLSQVKKESEEQIGAVATEVGGAKKDIEATKNDLEITKGKLERATGDMGVMSGLIARNHDDLDELKRRGDRNYFEFTLTKSKSGQKVGPVQLTLTKTDPKKSKYTLNVLVDDRNIEKKDRTAGEPVQFYVKGSARMSPYEIVVFDVGKNSATGYLATPKDTGGSAPSSAPAPATTPPPSTPTKPQS
jgi:multidrug efflux pump subunit AcrA (membrane-fusion protein)